MKMSVCQAEDFSGDAWMPLLKWVKRKAGLADTTSVASYPD
jgi:hypothetical protein